MSFMHLQSHYTVFASPESNESASSAASSNQGNQSSVQSPSKLSVLEL